MTKMQYYWQMCLQYLHQFIPVTLITGIQENNVTVHAYIYLHLENILKRNIHSRNSDILVHHI